MPGLADFDEPLFDFVDLDARAAPSAALPAAYTAPEAGLCKELPRLGSAEDPELDVAYIPALDARKGPGAHAFAAEGYDDVVSIRLTVAGAGGNVVAGMADWARQCPAWGIAHTLDDHGTQGWLVAQSSETLTRYQAGDIAGQWRNVIQVAVATLDNGVIVQTWYRTDDPAAESRSHILLQIVEAVGRARPRSALPPHLADWSSAQISALLPPLSLHVTVRASAGDDGEFASLCQSGGGVPVAPYRTRADWHDLDYAKWGLPHHPPEPEVTINSTRPGVDYLAELRREVATCTSHATEIPAQCGYLPNRQFLQSDSAMAEGEDTVRITHRWVRVESVQGYDRCVERIEALRVTQVRGLLVISRAIAGGPKGNLGDAPPLPLNTLDEIQAGTVRSINAA